jgi:uncharacterized protein YjdB
MEQRNTAVATVSSTGLVSGVANGTVSIRYTVTNGSGCQTQVSKSVTVNDLPTKPSISTIASTTFCAGGSVVLTSSAALVTSGTKMQ